MDLPIGMPMSGARMGMPPQGWDPVLMNRRAAFDVFDVAHDGTINAFELPMALMGCDDVRNAVQLETARNLREAEIQDACDRVGVQGGNLVTFNEFNQICEILVHSLRPKMQLKDAIADRHQQEEDEMVAIARAGSPQSPRGETAVITSMDHHTELGVVQKAFYAFDVDRSGSVSGHEVPRMLALVGIGPKGRDTTGGAFERKWHAALRAIYPPKEPSDLLNVFDFHDMCMVLNPNLIRELPERPPPPPPPVESLSLDELARLEQEERAKRAEEERKRREEEERVAKSTLHVKAPSGRTFCLLETSPDEPVASIMQRIEELEGIPVGQQRLVAQGWEMSPKQNLNDYGVRIGHPQRHKAHTVTLLIRQLPVGKAATRNIIGPLYITTAFNETYTIQAKEEDAVSDVMKRIEEVTGIPVVQQRLVGNGRELVSFERLRDGGVAPGDTVFLIVRGHYN